MIFNKINDVVLIFFNHSSLSERYYSVYMFFEIHENLFFNSDIW